MEHGIVIAGSSRRIVVTSVRVRTARLRETRMKLGLPLLVAVALLTLSAVGCSYGAKSWLIEHTSGPRGALVQELNSPDGRWAAEMYQYEDPGPTSDSVVTVYVRDVDDRGTERAVYYELTDEISMSWDNSQTLRVNGHPIAVATETYDRWP